jgi:hypothetical protein
VRLETYISWFFLTLKVLSPTNEKDNSERIRKEICQRKKTGRSTHEHTGIPESDRRRLAFWPGPFTS